MLQRKSKILIFTGFLVLIVIAALFASFLVSKKEAQIAQISETHLQKGIEYINSRKYDQAIKELNTALEINPQNYKARLRLGSVLFYLGELEKAETHYKKIVAEQKKEPPPASRAKAYYFLSQIKSITGNYPESITYGEKALEEEIDDDVAKTIIKASIYPIMATSYFYYTGDQEKIEYLLGKNLEIIEEAKYKINERERMAIKIDIYNLLAFYHLLFFEDNNLAMNYFNKILELAIDPEMRANAYYGLGKTYFFAKDYEKALDSLHKALNLAYQRNDFLIIQIYDELGKVYLELANCDESTKYFNKVLEKLDEAIFMADYLRRFEKTAAYLAFGQCAFINEEKDEALYFLEKGLDFFAEFETKSFYEELLYNTFYIVIHHKIAEIEYQNNDFEKAGERVKNISELIDSFSPQMLDIVERTYWPKEEVPLFDSIKKLESALEI